VATLGRAISRDYAGRTVDVVMILENAFIFGADLVRRISRPVVCHFVRAEIRDVKLAGRDRREVFFSRQPRLQGRDVLLVGGVLHSGVTQDFLVKRLLEGRPRSLRLAVLVDKPRERKVDLKPDYFGFASASNYWVGYGLAERRGWYRNLPYLGVLRAAGRRTGKTARRAG
jgi:hypoxanthine phosphoribosyltransferase